MMSIYNIYTIYEYIKDIVYLVQIYSLNTHKLSNIEILKILI